HPSGNLRPSQADKIFTDKIKKSCEDVGINFIDHIIVGAGNYFSFREEEIRK
ncbi:JAB domain-containing protein, partial [Streptococcus suis]